MIEIKDLTKSFDGVEVLSHISMTLESGKIYGLVGRNGSGKTMLMKHILGFVSPTSGTITIDGNLERILMRQIILEPLLKIQDFCQVTQAFAI
jgi:ABC-2 type transport system ATP-binding protein